MRTDSWYCPKHQLRFSLWEHAACPECQKTAKEDHAAMVARNLKRAEAAETQRKAKALENL